MRKETFDYLKARLREVRSNRIDTLKGKIVVPFWVITSTKALKKYRNSRDRQDRRIELKVHRETRKITEMIMLHKEDEAVKLLKKFESKKP